MYILLKLFDCLTVIQKLIKILKCFSYCSIIEYYGEEYHWKFYNNLVCQN